MDRNGIALYKKGSESGRKETVFYPHKFINLIQATVILQREKRFSNSNQFIEKHKV